jgi:hypothetical protein
MAIKDYNSINFRNAAVDRLTSKFGEDGPIDRKQKRMMNKASRLMNSALKTAPNAKGFGLESKKK